MMDITSFKQMMGMLGNFYVSDRMFTAIDRDNDGLISIEDYLVYNDILSYGSESEKNAVTFRIIDQNGDGAVSFGEFKLFWSHFIELYSEALQTKLNYDEAVIRQAFDQISKGEEEFNFEDFEDAKAKNPQLFDWIEQPGKYMQEFA